MREQGSRRCAVPLFAHPFPDNDEDPYPQFHRLKSAVDAPEGTAPRATMPSEVAISASTVGFPLESKISLPRIEMILP